jgi:hypothetical protein
LVEHGFVSVIVILFKTNEIKETNETIFSLFNLVSNILEKVTSNFQETWVIYALGGGWGHLTRALALGRLAATGNRCIKILTNSLYTAYLRHQLPGVGCQIQVIAPDAPFADTCEQVRQILLNTQCDRLIVDTFPRGLGGELTDVLPTLKHIPRILIHRDLKPEYIRRFDLRSFVTQHFEAVIVPGEGEDLPLSNLPIVRHTNPWLIRNAEELPDRNQAFRLLTETIPSLLLEVESSLPKLILVCAAGQPEELSLFGFLTLQLATAFPKAIVRCLAAKYPVGCPPALWVSYWPAIECLPAADIVVSSAGYNTVHECAAVGVPLVAFALKRLYDRQHRRAFKCAHWVQNIEEAIATVELLLNQQHTNTQQQPISYINGAAEAVNIIEQLNVSTYL